MLRAMRVKLRVFLGRQLAAGEDDDRNIGTVRRRRAISSSTSKPVMSGRRRSSTTQSHGWSRSVASASLAGAGGDDLDIVVPEQLADAQLLGGVVLHDQQALAPRRLRIP